MSNNGSIDISALKTGNTEPTESKNIDGNELRDFGGGMKEFDPAANGFFKQEEPEHKSDSTKALECFDEQLKKRQEEVRIYNELLDQYGGEITEEQLREELGQERVTDLLQDGVGGKNEDNPGNKPMPDVMPKESRDALENTEQVQPSELDELEKELEDDSYMEPAKPNMTVAEMATPPVEREMVIATPPKTETAQDKVSGTASLVSNIGNMSESTPDENGMTEEDKDLAALDGDEVAAPTENFEAKLKKELDKKMRPISVKYDLSSAVVSNQPITVTNTLSNVIPLDKKTFTWALFRSKRPITMRSFSAIELNNLSGAMRNTSRSREIFKTLWDHSVGSGKGKDFDTWAKCTSYFDVDHIWFSVYGACFQDSNYLPFSCNKCDNLTVSADVPIMDMVKFSKPEYKTELENIINMPGEPNMGNIFVEYRTQVSDNIVIGFREPSIYDAIIVPTLLDKEFKDKYDETINLCAYIANIYNISVENGQVTLRPIAVKEFRNNETKTLKARIIQYTKIIKSLTSDQYSMIVGHINTITEEDNVNYGLPSTTCDHCKAELPEERDAAADLVFMRHRLGILGA